VAFDGNRDLIGSVRIWQWCRVCAGILTGANAMEISRAYARRLVREGKARFSGIDRTEAGSTSKDDGWIWGHIDRQDLNRVDCYRIERTID